MTLSQGKQFIEHYGVKGQKWGVRRSRSERRAAASEDSRRASEIRTKSRSTGRSSLSNKELKEAIERMNLEQSYIRLSVQSSTVGRGALVAKELLGVRTTMNQVNSAIPRSAVNN